MSDNYWDRDWTDYVLPVCFSILGVLAVITVAGTIGSIVGWW